MKFAFSTVGCPKWDFPTILSRAKEYGYDGVEVRGYLNESALTASDPFLTDPEKLRGLFADANIEMACLSSALTMTGSKRKDAAVEAGVRTFIDSAQRLGCGYVRIFDAQVKPGQSRAATAGVLGRWLLPLGDYAAEHGVTLVVENALSFRTAKEMWQVLETINHPAVFACWDVFNAALVGETAWVSVPVLNSRIAYTQVKDAQLGPLGASFCKLGEGTVGVHKFLSRLQGIGYDGWVTFEWEKAWLPNIAEPEEMFPDAIAKLREWTAPVDKETKKSVAKAK